MVAQLTETLVDYSNEKSSYQINVPDITAANLTATETFFANLWTAISPLVIGNQVSRRFPVLIRFSGALPADPEAQREKKWRVHYKDTSAFLDSPDNTVPNPYFGRAFSFTIPTADLADGNVIAGTDQCDISIDPWLTVVGLLQTGAKSPVGGNITVTGVNFEGANN